MNGGSITTLYRIQGKLRRCSVGVIVHRYALPPHGRKGAEDPSGVARLGARIDRARVLLGRLASARPREHGDVARLLVSRGGRLDAPRRTRQLFLGPLAYSVTRFGRHLLSQLDAPRQLQGFPRVGDRALDRLPLDLVTHPPRAT